MIFDKNLQVWKQKTCIPLRISMAGIICMPSHKYHEYTHTNVKGALRYPTIISPSKQIFQNHTQVLKQPQILNILNNMILPICLLLCWWNNQETNSKLQWAPCVARLTCANLSGLWVAAPSRHELFSSAWCAIWNLCNDVSCLACGVNPAHENLHEKVEDQIYHVHALIFSSQTVLEPCMTPIWDVLHFCWHCQLTTEHKVHTILRQYFQNTLFLAFPRETTC